MAIIRKESSLDVVEASERRIINIFNNGVPVYMSFSGGKDSLCLAHLVLKLIQQGRINPALLTVQFIDEEAIFSCIEKTVLEWRKKFLMVGAKFEWFCIEVKHYNCFNALTNDESFICWDRYKKQVWVRKPPKFAIREHPLLRPRKDAYQDFLPRICVDGLTIIGIRTAESIQRLQNIATMTRAGKNCTAKRQLFPIYDWTDKDVWLYLKENHIEIPEIYLYLWQSGTSKGRLRVSQFFSVDTAKSLVKMNEYYPDLMERIIRREPNAYLASLYWDSEMFGKRTKTRRELEGEDTKKNYKAELIVMLNNIDEYFPSEHQKHIAKSYKRFLLSVSSFATEKDYKEMYEGLISGDPKLRAYRALYQRVYGRYIEKGKKEHS